MTYQLTIGGRLMITQEEKERVLKSIRNLHDEIDMCIGNLVNSRISHDEKMEGMMISQMETLLVQSQQEFSYLYHFINDIDFYFPTKRVIQCS